jgi:pyruvate dehydrogenase E2 component (dihydrolipoamide acetyltransferase)
VGEFRMPSLGADMDEGTLIEWLVAPGDQVHRGDIVAVVDTEKSDIEVEVFEDGTIGELLVEVGATVPVGTPLARIDSGAPTATPPPTATPVTATATETVPVELTTVVDGPPRGLPTTARGAGRVLSPLVRHLAEELHVDLGDLTGTGPGGVVTRHDVEVARGGPAVAVEVSATGRPPPLTGPPETGRVRASPYARRLAAERGVDLVAVSGSGPQGAVLALDVPTAPASPALGREASARGVIGRAMARSKREIPHYYLQTTIDLDAALAWMRDRNADRSVAERVLPAALLLKATAVAAAEHPELNGWWEDGHRPSSRVHLGVAIALRRGGLVAPGIADADQMPISDLMAALRDLTARTRAGRVRQQEWTGPTITVTSLGDLGVEAVWGVIHPPQLAMVGYGVVHDGVVASDGQATVHPVVVATLAADHRSSDGIQGATFLGRIAKLLQDPEALDLPSPSKDGHRS